MDLEFMKLHGNGNDFILIDEYGCQCIPDDMKAQFAALYCDRRFGIGGDGVLYLQRSTQADLRMRLFQPDESEAEMCGNGIRCFAKYAFDTGYVEKSCSIETLAGIIRVEMGYEDDTFQATIDMPDPKFAREDIPATGTGEYRETIDGMEVYAVNTGVPHAVVFVETIEAVSPEETAPPIRHHQTFPKGANVNFVQRAGGDSLKIRTFERGVEGETLSCGTGATAAAAIAYHLGYVTSPVTVETSGGPLIISLGEVTRTTGPATTVFKGIISF
ncbi:MAG: diaminopimelate epimerase [Methanomicrobiales archaeon]|nr:diaminopimelate epimerase [Methanomicrobiales archaeon]